MIFASPDLLYSTNASTKLL